MPLNLNFNFDGVKSLKEWWPIIKSNLQSIQSVFNSHFAGTEDKHNSQDINYSGSVPGKANVKDAIEATYGRVDYILEQTALDPGKDPEVVDARASTAKSKTFGTIGARVEELEEESIAHMADIVHPISTNAIGNDIVDDTVALQNLLNNGAGRLIVLKKDKVYKVTDELIIPDNTIIYFNGAKIKMYLNGEKRGLVVGNYNTIFDAWVEVISTNPAANGQYHCPIIIGNALNGGAGKKHVNIFGGKAKSNKPMGNCLGIFGDSSDINVINFEVEDSTAAGIGVIVHWGNLIDAASTGSTHPHNVTLRNIKIGNLSNTASGVYGAFLSAVYNVTIENLTVKNVGGDGIGIYAGDYGFNYASAEDKPHALQNIIVRNTDVKVNKIGYWINKQAGLTYEIYNTNTLLENVKSVGNKTHPGILTLTSRGLMVVNGDISEHLYGAHFGEKVKNVTFRGGNYHNNEKAGIYVDDTTSYVPEDITVDSVHFENNGVTDGSVHRTGIYFNRCIRGNAFNCTFGADTELYQFYGIRLGSTARDCSLINNHVRSVISGGVAYSLGSGADTLLLKSFISNTAAAGITLIAGMSNIPTLINSKGDFFFARTNKRGTYTANGDGTSTSLSIPHGLAAAPSYYEVTAASANAGTATIDYVTANATNIVVRFKSPMPSGTGNIIIVWKAEE